MRDPNRIDTVLEEIRDQLRFVCDQEDRTLDVQELIAVLGVTLTAAVSGVADREIVSAWAAGNLSIPDAEAHRLATAVRAWRKVAGADGDDVARAWFIGANPWLGDDSAVTAIREDRQDQALVAARAQADDTFSG